jgi:hypothetical protein
MSDRADEHLDDADGHHRPGEEDLGELSEAARRGMQRAGVHLMKAAIEVVAGLSAFLEEMGASSRRAHGDEDHDPPQHIEVE